MYARRDGSGETASVHASLSPSSCLLMQGTKIFQYCTCPAGQVTYNFHSSCKHMFLFFKSVYNKGVIFNMTYKVPYNTV